MGHGFSLKLILAYQLYVWIRVLSYTAFQVSSSLFWAFSCHGRSPHTWTAPWNLSYSNFFAMAGSLHDAIAPGMYHFRCHVTLVQSKVDSCQWEAVSCLEGTIPHRSIHFPDDFGYLKGGSVLRGEVPPDSHWQSGCLTRLASPSAHRKLGAYADGASIGVRSRPSYALQIQREGYHLRWQPQD